MILKSFQILAICTSMAVTPSNFHYDQIKKLDTQSYTINMSTNSVGNWTSTLNDEETNLTTKYTTKWQNTVTADAMMINSYIYGETYNRTIDSSKVTYAYPNRLKTTSNIMVTLQITPYKNVLNNNTTISLIMFMTTGLWTDSNITKYRTVTDIYTSTDTRFYQFMDLSAQTAAAPYANYNVIQQITNAQNGFLYSKTTTEKNHNLSTNNTATSEQLLNTISLDPNKTNFIVMDIQLMQQNENQQQIDDFDVIQLVSQSNIWGRPRESTFLTITGEYIPNIGNYEVIDLPGVMWEVLTMPFTFISIAFNLTLFPNTPYQVNLSNLFLSILGALVFIFILKTFVFKK